MQKFKLLDTENIDRHRLKNHYATFTYLNCVLMQF